jgi:hypothetical protein
MFIAILSVKLKFKSYLQIHKMAFRYWSVIAQGMDLTPISKRQLRELLKKSVISLENQQSPFFSCFLNLTADKVINTDKMTNKAHGPLWHKKHKQQGIIPKELRGIDRHATRCKSTADGWVYGHGSFTITSHKTSVLGCFMWMWNSANEAKRLWAESYETENPFSNGVSEILDGENGLWESSLIAETTITGNYCFRIVNNDNIELGGYNFYPEIKVSSP